METLESLQAQYEAVKALGLKLNMQRGQPSDADFDLSNGLLTAVTDDTPLTTPSGIALRNYPGGVAGLPEARELFAEVLRVRPEEMIVGNNASLELMGDVLMWALLRGLKDSDRPWVQQSPKMIVTVPGYDRHFHILEQLGIGMIPVEMTSEGPDMDAVEALAVSDPSVKGIFFVPTYSNPTGDTVSAATVQRLATMQTAAPDFTILADDAYAIHHLTNTPAGPATQPAPRLRSGRQPRPRLHLWLHLQNHLCRGRRGLYGNQHRQRRLHQQTLGSDQHWPQ